MSTPGRSEPGALFFAWYLSQVGVCQVLSFFHYIFKRILNVKLGVGVKKLIFLWGVEDIKFEFWWWVSSFSRGGGGHKFLSFF